MIVELAGQQSSGGRNGWQFPSIPSSVHFFRDIPCGPAHTRDLTVAWTLILAVQPETSGPNAGLGQQLTQRLTEHSTDKHILLPVRYARLVKSEHAPPNAAKASPAAASTALLIASGRRRAERDLAQRTLLTDQRQMGSSVPIHHLVHACNRSPRLHRSGNSSPRVRLPLPPSDHPRPSPPTLVSLNVDVISATTPLPIPHLGRNQSINPFLLWASVYSAPSSLDMRDRRARMSSSSHSIPRPYMPLSFPAVRCLHHGKLTRLNLRCLR